MSRAALIWDAHRLLTRLVNAEAAAPASEATLHWLEERGLVEKLTDESGRLQLRATERGRVALLGSVAPVMN